VTIFADGTPVGTVPLVNGRATFEAATIHAGARSITATYNGDAAFESSTTTAMNQNIRKAPTAVAPQSTPILIGESPLITVSVIVTPGTAVVAAGSVSISEGRAVLGNETLAGGKVTFNLSPFLVGDYPLIVNYSGSEDFEPSSATMIQSVTLPAVSIHGTRVTEGNHGLTTTSLVVTLSAAIALPVRISFSTIAGSATEGEDYENASGVIELAPGELTKSIELHIFGDTTAEEDETFSVLLSNPENATIETSAAFVVIVNDDAVPPRRRPSRH
jgi:hypothetical protein